MNQARKQARYLIGPHANSVALSFPFYTTGGRRGTIEPASRAAWFASCRTFLAPYLKIAQRGGADSFVLGTELSSMESDQRWTALVAAAKKIYSGDLGYDANGDKFVTGSTKVPVDDVDVDAYFPVKVPDSASVRTLVNGWNTWLDRRTTGTLRGITVSEAGIGAMDGAYAKPGDCTSRRTVNTHVQAAWYTAACEVVRERRMKGVYFWSLSFASTPTATASTSPRRAWST
ncbi:hypothetical protein OK074_3804 [Actinobacteria bacterium OK074]|nr:hypothetical protein OK074_3804 [Actinobacteria bacterium OK074]